MAWDKRQDRRAAFESVLVDATGRGGFVARRSGPCPPAQDRLIGIARRYPGEAAVSAEPWTLVEAVSQGWWYSAPLPDGDLLAVFMTDADLIGGRAGLMHAWPSWLAQAGHTRSRLRGRSPLAGWHMQSAASSHTGHSLDEPWLAVGDAVLACDPLAGRGLTLALETSLAAAHAISARRGRSSKGVQCYSQAVNALWQDYLRKRFEICRTEMRWMDAPFWQRRHHVDQCDRRTVR